jgi:YebC/PmpR family DNA-binding regulatory protein
MSGHSHWAGIKHKKGAVDAKRGKLFSKLSKAIIVAARHGGGDPDANLKLRYAIDKARQASMPKDNIDRAVKKGTGELEGGSLAEIVYEGYGPHGVAVICEILTDNRNRTAGEIRKMFEVSGGNLGQTGCVAWMFERKGLFVVDAKHVEEDRLLEVVLEAGADDVNNVEGMFEVTCDPAQFQAVREALENARIPTEVAELSQIPSTTVDLNADQGRKVLRFMEALDEHEDVQNVYANFNIPESAMAEAAE